MKDLSEELYALQERSQLRHLKSPPPSLLDFSSNDYLGLNSPSSPFFSKRSTRRYRFKKKRVR